MSNQVLDDFTKFLGLINFDCSGNRLDHKMNGNVMVFTDQSIQKVYEAYRGVLATGYRMGRTSMVNDINKMVEKK